MVWRPWPSRYDISIDSTPIRRMRYRPAIVSPSFPYIGWPTPSLSTAIVILPGCTVPMNFNGIGGSGGGPVGTGGATGVTTAGAVRAAATGAGFGLNRKRFRCASTGFGRSPSSAFRWTSGAVIPPVWPGRAGPLTELDDEAAPWDVVDAGDVVVVVVDVVDVPRASGSHTRKTFAPRATTSAPSSICLRRSVAMPIQRVVRRQLQREGQRFADFSLQQ